MGNSVIYRPAYDAEVEYLESTGTQWIDTGLTSTSSTIIEVDAQSTTVQVQDRFVGNSTGYLEIYISGGLLISFAYNNKTLNTQVPADTTRHTLKIDNYNAKAYIDGSEIDIERTSTYGTITILSRGAANILEAKLYSAKIWNGATLVRDFIPVRIGQVGYMYDKVTKQLFANKGTGNFILGNDVSNAVIPQQRCVLYFGNQRSVVYERIYEEYEWIEGDAYTHIDIPVNIYRDTVNTLLVPKVNNAVVAYQGMKEIGNNNIVEFRTMIGGEQEFTIRHGVRINGTATSVIKSFSNNYIGEIFEISTYRNGNNYCGTINGTTYNIANGDIQSADTDLTVAIILKEFKLGYFHILTKFSLFPCRLLTDIPAILDGNGIARQVGECGMWDKVSGRFYGNVASSGTFTVKGAKCYEEYKWLVGEINTQGTMMQFTIGKNFSFKRRMYRGSNTGYFYGSGYSYYTNTSYYTLLIWETSSSSNVFALQPPTSGEDITIESTTLKLTFNGTEVPSYCNSYNFVITSHYNSGMKCATSVITVDGSVRYVPCKLTHGIPASMDANGIARQSGECGMWDKVNDVFYGNMANSGSFTVSND